MSAITNKDPSASGLSRTTSSESSSQPGHSLLPPEIVHSINASPQKGSKPLDNRVQHGTPEGTQLSTLIDRRLLGNNLVDVAHEGDIRLANQILQDDSQILDEKLGEALVAFAEVGKLGSTEWCEDFVTRFKDRIPDHAKKEYGRILGDSLLQLAKFGFDSIVGKKILEHPHADLIPNEKLGEVFVELSKGDNRKLCSDFRNAFHLRIPPAYHSQSRIWINGRVFSGPQLIQAIEEGNFEEASKILDREVEVIPQEDLQKAFLQLQGQKNNEKLSNQFEQKCSDKLAPVMRKKEQIDQGKALGEGLALAVRCEDLNEVSALLQDERVPFIPPYLLADIWMDAGSEEIQNAILNTKWQEGEETCYLGDSIPLDARREKMRIETQARSKGQ